jgi:hypothetical protein
MRYKRKLLKESPGELAKRPDARRHPLETMVVGFRAREAGGTIAAIALVLVASEEAAQHEADLQ